ncbi:MAG: YegP family protein [Mailhella sp.]|nr:YegP family protein [Mailhella sp.]
MGKFVIKPAKNGIMFNLKAGNSQVIATSEVYSKEAACRKGIASVQKNAPIANLEDQTEEEPKTFSNPKFELYQDKAGKFRFRLKARNGQIIAVSEAYEAKKSALNGIESVRKNAADGEIVKEEA